MTKEKKSSSNECISCRNVLWILTFCGFGVNYMLRNNLNLAIVAIVVSPEIPAIDSECMLEHSSQNVSTRYQDPTSVSNSTIIMSTNETSKTILRRDDRYPWNEYQQGLILGAYYWLHWLTQLPGGLLARKYGTKLIFGLGNLLVAFMGFLIPAATHYSLNAMISLRVAQGILAGIVWPSMHDMTAKWIPPNERSRFVSSYLGSSVGAAITYPLCAIIIANYGWEAVFYITSTIAIVWYIFWLCLVYDSPRLHPRISEEEKNYILKSLAESSDEYKVSSKKGKEVPWKAILTSGPFWVTIMAHWGGVWGFITLMTQAPSYFNYVQGLNINTTGLLAGVPHVARMAFSYLFSMLSDWLLRTKRLSLTGVRKLANLVCSGGQCLLTVGLSFSGCKPKLAAFFMIAGTAVNGAVSSGTLSAFVDLSPNYASILLGICNLVTSQAGFLSPLIVGILTNNNQTIGQWRYAFLISAANLVLSCIVHLIWGTSAEQPWNNYVSKKSSTNAEDDSRDNHELVTFTEKDGTIGEKKLQKNREEVTKISYERGDSKPDVSDSKMSK